MSQKIRTKKKVTFFTNLLKLLLFTVVRWGGGRFFKWIFFFLEISSVWMSAWPLVVGLGPTLSHQPGTYQNIFSSRFSSEIKNKFDDTVLILINPSPSNVNKPKLNNGLNEPVCSWWGNELFLEMTSSPLQIAPRSHWISKGPFKYYVIMFLTFLGPPTQLFDDLQFYKSSRIAIFWPHPPTSLMT